MQGSPATIPFRPLLGIDVRGGRVMQGAKPIRRVHRCGEYCRTGPSDKVRSCVMPRYHLNVLDGITSELDEVGLELSNDAEALTEIIKAIHELRACLRSLVSGHGHRLTSVAQAATMM